MKNFNKPALIISLDFELFWGMQDVSSLEDYGEHLLGGRKAIPELLALFQKHDIHATWATVGFLFADSREEIEQTMPGPDMLPTYRNPVRSAYRCLSDLGGGEEENPCFFAPSLIEAIASTPGMEIGSHTFSHFYCREAGQTPEQFEADMAAARDIAASHGYSVTSVVLPRNQCEPSYIEVLHRLGYTAFRDEENDWIHEKVKIRPLLRLLRLADVYFPLTGQGGYRPQKEQGIWNLTGSRMYKPRFGALAFLEKQKLRRIKRQMLHAAKNGLVFHLWWHPHNIGVNTEFHLKQLEEIFSFFEGLRQKYGMRSLNMREMTEELESSGSFGGD